MMAAKSLIRINSLWLFFLSFFLISGCGGPQPEESPEPVSAAQDTIEVFPSDTIGMLMGDTNYVFGTISDAVVLDNGKIAILDEAAGCCRVYDSEGNFITQISRRGSGPAELLRPGGMARLSDNSVLLLDHAEGAKRFTPDGEYIDLMIDYQGREVPQWAWGVDDMGFVGAFTNTEPAEDELIVNFIVARWDGEPEQSVEYFRNSFPYNPQRMDEFLTGSFLSAAFTASPEGMVYVAPTSSEEYRVDVFNPDGSLYGRIERDIPRVEKTPSEIEDETAMFEAILRERGIPEDHIFYEPDPYRWMIQPLGLGTDGRERVWVRNSTSDEVVMDVYTRDGEHLGVVRFSGVTGADIVDFLVIKVQTERILVYSLQDMDYPKLYIVDMPDIP